MLVIKELRLQVLSFLSLWSSLTLFFFRGKGWDWSLNTGFHACKVGALLLEPHLQSILLFSQADFKL
jgi:hypothetical protein